MLGANPHVVGTVGSPYGPVTGTGTIVIKG